MKIAETMGCKFVISVQKNHVCFFEIERIKLLGETFFPLMIHIKTVNSIIITAGTLVIDLEAYLDFPGSLNSILTEINIISKKFYRIHTVAV